MSANVTWPSNPKASGSGRSHLAAAPGQVGVATPTSPRLEIEAGVAAPTATGAPEEKWGWPPPPHCAPKARAARPMGPWLIH